MRPKPITWSEGDRGCVWAYTLTGHYVIENLWGEWYVNGHGPQASLELAKEYCQSRHERMILREITHE